MNTAIYNEFSVVQIIKRCAKTSQVKNLTSDYDRDAVKRVNNSELTPDEFIPLNEETAKTAKIIININNPQWGMKKFNYRAEEVEPGKFMHTAGTGFNSRLIFDMHLWRVIR